MKNILLLITFVASFNLFSQELYKEYTLGKISVVTKEGKTQGNIYLDLNKEGSIGLSLDKNSKNEFVTFMRESFEKVQEWTEVAKVNNVQELRKEAKKVSLNGFFKYGKWNFGTANMSSTFVIREGEISSFIYVGKIQSSSNQFIKSDSVLFYITETLVNEIENYLSDESINEFISSKTAADDLFKD